MSWYDKKFLYESIEAAVMKKQPVRFPGGSYPSLIVFDSPTGPVYSLPGVYWMDERRNVYTVWMQVSCHHLPDMFVAGTATLDGFSSSDTSMIRPENRYKSII